MKRKQIFEGIKVADFSWILAGPTVSRMLAEHGATVVRVESHKRPDIARLQAPFKDFIPGLDRAGLFASFNTNKYSISLDMNTDSGKTVAEKLIQWADVVTDSFVPGTMKKLGIDYERAKELKPDIIYYSTTSQGQYGPHSSFAAYGAQTTCLAGLGLLCGRPDRDPVHIYGAYTDMVAPWYLIVALVGALDRRRKTGKGMYLDQSQLETGVTLLAPELLDYTVNGRISNRMANRDSFAVPHGAYRCQGEDRWIAIAVETEQQWMAFKEAIGYPEWITDSKFDTFKDRKDNEDELDQRIAEWASHQAAEQIMDLMQSKGIPAGVVNNMEGVYNDPQFKHREHCVYLEHKVIGRHAYHNEAVRFSKTPPKFWKAGPCIGEDNEYILKDVLGISDEEIVNMIIDGTITSDDNTPLSPTI